MEGTAGPAVMPLGHFSFEVHWQYSFAPGLVTLSDAEHTAGAVDFVPHELREGLIVPCWLGYLGTYLHGLGSQGSN